MTLTNVFIQKTNTVGSNYKADCFGSWCKKELNIFVRSWWDRLATYPMPYACWGIGSFALGVGHGEPVLRHGLGVMCVWLNVVSCPDHLVVSLRSFLESMSWLRGGWGDSADTGPAASVVKGSREEGERAVRAAGASHRWQPCALHVSTQPLQTLA